jgi:hypothetical protein
MVGATTTTTTSCCQTLQTQPVVSQMSLRRQCLEDDIVAIIPWKWISMKTFEGVENDTTVSYDYDPVVLH